jgi:hypothetical protein
MMGSKPNAADDSSLTLLDFDIQTIPLADAVKLVAAGGGKYGTLAHQIIERFATRKSDETFAFGVPGGQELPERLRRGVSTSLTTALKRAGIPWKVTYSGERKIFIVVPRKQKGALISPTPAQPKAEGKRQNPRRVPWTLSRLAAIAANTFGVTVSEIKGRSQDRQITSARAAFARYAINHKQSKNLGVYLKRNVTGLYRLQPEPGDLEKLDAMINQNGGHE